ncbi:LuxR C-terminal-related transcriptional regulator [Pendulispora albinea]|uniref:LuxR C-terminal-related transcriptional regulator n=1 Tax=Pendulispora albinea TaxID=2741071 RepID=A0ABZ2LKD6_9BACT
MRQAVRAPIAFCFTATADHPGDAVGGMLAVDDDFAELPSQCLQALADEFRFPIAFSFTSSHYCIPVMTLSQSSTFADTAHPLIPSNGNALLVYLRVEDTLYGMAGVARRHGAPDFDDEAIGHLEQIGPLLSSLTMHYTHVLHLQRKHPVARNVPTLLSEREQQVARLLAEGYSCVNTAAVLNLSENTVRTYVRRLYRKLDVTNRVDLVQRLIATVAAAG